MLAQKQLIYRPWALVPVERDVDEKDWLIASPDDALQTGRTDPDFRSKQHPNIISTE